MTKHSVKRVDDNHVTYRGFLITTNKNWHQCMIAYNRELKTSTRKMIMNAIDSFLDKNVG